jgi:hypothetical protein
MLLLDSTAMRPIASRASVVGVDKQATTVSAKNPVDVCRKSVREVFGANKRIETHFAVK